MLGALKRDAEITSSSERFMEPSSGDKIKISASTKSDFSSVLFFCPTTNWFGLWICFWET